MAAIVEILRHSRHLTIKYLKEDAITRVPEIQSNFAVVQVLWVFMRQESNVSRVFSIFIEIDWKFDRLSYRNPIERSRVSNKWKYEWFRRAICSQNEL